MAEYEQGVEMKNSMKEISNQEWDDEDGDLDDAAKQEKEKERTLWTRIWQGLAVTTFVACIVAMVLSRSIVMFVSGIIGCVISPIVFKRQMELQGTDALREVQNKLRQEVNRFQEENNKLSSEIDKLEVNVGNLKESEGKLELIAKEQGSNVESLVALTKENGEIVREMDKLARADTLQSVMDILLQSDRDQSFSLGAAEVNMLILRFKTDPRVKVNEENLRATLKEYDNDIPMKVLIMDLHESTQDKPEEEHLFIVHVLEK